MGFLYRYYAPEDKSGVVYAPEAKSGVVYAFFGGRDKLVCLMNPALAPAFTISRVYPGGGNGNIKNGCLTPPPVFAHLG